MKIMEWNIRHGGAKKKQDKIIDNIIGYNADIIILTEYRENKGERIKSRLSESGWKHQLSTEPPENTNGIFIASKYHIEKSDENYELPDVPHRWLHIDIKNKDLQLLALHIPNSTDRCGKKGKKDFWQKIIKFAEKKSSEKILITGDFNTGLKIDAEGIPFVYSEYMEKLNKAGWADSWRYLNPRKKEFTWYSNVKNGFRLDYAYLSPALKQYLLQVNHSHQERIDKLSDHSSLIIELDIN